MNKIVYALASLYLAAASPVYGDGVPSTQPVERIEVSVHQSATGLESVINGTTIQHGFFREIYRVDADLTLKNKDAIPGPLTLNYSLCFTDGKSSSCLDGKAEQLLSGLPPGELKKKLALKARRPFTEINLAGKMVSLTKLKPKITIQLKRNQQGLYIVDHYLPPVQEYQCKKWCPG